MTGGASRADRFYDILSLIERETAKLFWDQEFLRRHRLVGCAGPSSSPTTALSLVYYVHQALRRFTCAPFVDPEPRTRTLMCILLKNGAVPNTVTMAELSPELREKLDELEKELEVR